MALPDEHVPGRGGSSRQRALEEMVQRYCTTQEAPTTADEAQASLALDLTIHLNIPNWYYTFTAMHCAPR